MAVNLDTRIPLSAVYEGPTGTERRQASQANELALRLNELKLDYENRKRKRDADTEKYMGESIKRIQQGTPEQAVTDFNWNLPQQPAPMQGPMLNAPAYRQPEPLFDVQRRVTAPAVAGRQPTMDDMYAASVDALFRAGDYQGAFKAMKSMRSGQVSQMKPYAGSLSIGADGQYYAYNQSTGKLEPTGQYAPQKQAAPEKPVRVETANGIEFVIPKPGMVLKPPVGPVKAEKPPAAVHPSVDESKAAGFYYRMVETSKLLDSFEKSGKPNEWTSIVGGVPVVGGYLQRGAMSNAQATYKNAADAWVRAKLRKESGAVIGDDEAKAEYSTYFPMPGENSDVVKQKQQLRKIAEEEMRLASGRAASMIKGGNPGSGAEKIEVASLPAASKYPGKVATDRQTGTRYKSDGKNWVRIP